VPATGCGPQRLLRLAATAAAPKLLLGHRQIEPDQHLIHSVQGSQYRANAYRQMQEIHKITPSMSDKDCCWDNTVAESFFSTL
jgi:transposase InsO family protein